MSGGPSLRKLSPPLSATPPLGHVWLLIEIFCLALSGILIIQTVSEAQHYQASRVPSQNLGLLLMMLSLCLFLVPAFLSRLPTLERVLKQRVAPPAAFQRFLRHALLRLLLGWALLSLPLAIEAGLLDPAALAMAGAGPACLALTLSGSLWAFAAWHGWIARGWLLPLPLLLMLPGWFGLAALWRAWRDLGWPPHLAGCALLLFSLWRLNSQLATKNVSPDSPARWLVAWRRSGLARWRLLDPRGYTTFLVLMPQLLLPTLSKGSSNALLIQAWGTPLDMWHGLRMLFFTAMLVGTLGSRDLHWRWLLAPQGRFRAGLALRVARDSWLPLAAAVGLISLLVCAVQVLILKRPAGQALPALLTISLPLLCDFSLALMLALLLRGWFSTKQIAGSLIAVGLVMSCLLWSMWSSEAVQQPLSSWFDRDWFSCLLELTLAAALLRWAQAVWAHKDLHELLRTTQARPKTGWEES